MAQGPLAFANHQINRLAAEDRAIHDWYQFVLGYPPHLVDQYLEEFQADPSRHIVFDPFCGTGTTPVQAKKKGYQTIAVDANPIAWLATSVKTTWNLNLRALEKTNEEVIDRYEVALAKAGLNTEIPPLFQAQTPKHGSSDEVDPGAVKRSLPKDLARVMPYGFISPLPFAKVTLLKEIVESVPHTNIRNLYRLAIAAILVEGVGNIGFGPEIYMTLPKKDAPVLKLFANKIEQMLGDLRCVQQQGLHHTASEVFQDDSRTLEQLGTQKIDVVITSPPYPNEKDYTRSTRLESIILGFIQNIEDLRRIKRRLIKSNTRAILKGEDRDDSFVKKFASIQELAREIEDRRIELRKTSGFERLYHRVVTLYFGGLYRHLAALKPRLNRGARLAYVVGDQMSFFRIHIKTGQLLAELADDLGYKVDRIDLWRERISTTTKLMLREEVILLRKP